jgi:hypothetical protein
MEVVGKAGSENPLKDYSDQETFCRLIFSMIYATIPGNVCVNKHLCFLEYAGT